MYERTCSDLSTARAVAKRTYEAAVELFAMLCKQYNLNPTADGVIVSHREGHSRGIASNHGDPEHLWNGPGTNYGTTGKYTGKGTFTIVETRSGQGSNVGWSKLKSGAGWISLDYAKRV